MSSENQVVVIDAGNTLIKVGRFQDDKLTEVRRFSFQEIDKMVKWTSEIGLFKTTLSSVLSESDTKLLIEQFDTVFVVNDITPLPIEIKYSTADTLGIDRVCNAVFINNQAKTNNAVAIDIGTCIKFDFVKKDQGYIGGSIAPGIRLRYKSLNDYTGNLPYLSNKTTSNLVGTSTKTSIESGITNGIKAEIQGMIDQYESHFGDLTFFMTGGDASYFDFHSKNDIFADENLTLKGLYEIYKHNA